ncbi:FHA domain-containing protein [Paraburkholderia sp. MMS20-SJTN17]|uniref:FHA domain-containing protein n=1 Tax=Paraburkholderia translucens TaxID=2886945 RepID=A0ABS8K6W1_9BURK|nr:FHA domain-containing protein [Paraburkholderia sp. MMS20-SJTN17]MCC8400481.1 FHA domain-containing protein [Paraburkholderia sp. MMS20-SJTN17]
MSHRRFKSALRMLRSGASGLALALVTAPACAAPLQAVAVSQPEPGNVTLTVLAPGAAPVADAFTLQLPGADTAPTKVAAQSVEPASVLPPDLATAVLLCVDRSGSMHSAVPAIKAALKDVLARPRPDLRIALMSFGSDTPAPTPFYSESAPILEAVDAIRAEIGRDGKTRLYDALNIGMSTLANAPLRGPKRLVVITDGKDEGSQTRFDVLSVLMQRRGQPMDAIAFGQSAQKTSSALATLANRSSGAFVLATSPTSLAEALRDDLGTAPASAYDVRFHYDAAPGLPPLRSAQVIYAAGAGAPPVVMSIRAGLAAPAPSAAQPPPSPSPTVASAALAGPASGHHAESKTESANPTSSAHGSAMTIGSVKISVKFGFSVLVGLAATLSVLAYTLRRKHVFVPPPDEPRPPEPKQPRQATHIGVMFPPPSPGRPAALLVNEGSRGATHSYAIEKSNVRIGADEANDLIVRDYYVSRKHANIRFESGTLYLTDLGSSNGTFLNGARVKQVMTLSPGDQIRFGHSTWEVRRAAEASVAGRSREHFERPVP